MRGEGVSANGQRRDAEDGYSRVDNSLRAEGLAVVVELHVSAGRGVAGDGNVQLNRHAKSNFGVGTGDCRGCGHGSAATAAAGTAAAPAAAPYEAGYKQQNADGSEQMARRVSAGNSGEQAADQQKNACETENRPRHRHRGGSIVGGRRALAGRGAG